MANPTATPHPRRRRTKPSSSAPREVATRNPSAGRQLRSSSARPQAAARANLSSRRQEFRKRYAEGTTPWDSGIPSAELIRVLEAGHLPGGTVLEFGCGTGTNAIELARRGYDVTAVDLADVAIRRARSRARSAGVSVQFHVGDLTTAKFDGKFDVLFDRGVYHGIRSWDLPGFLRTLERVSRPGTRWLSLAGNAKEPSDRGPPVVQRLEFETELGGLFRFVEVREFRFELGGPFHPLGWSILMERL